MKRKQYTTEQIITTLRKVEVLVNEGNTVVKIRLRNTSGLYIFKESLNGET